MTSSHLECSNLAILLARAWWLTEMAPNVCIQQQLIESGDSWMYPYQRTPMGNPYISPIYWVFMGYNPQESLGCSQNCQIMWNIFSTQPALKDSLRVTCTSAACVIPKLFPTFTRIHKIKVSRIFFFTAGQVPSPRCFGSWVGISWYVRGVG